MTAYRYYLVPSIGKAIYYYSALKATGETQSKKWELGAWASQPAKFRRKTKPASLTWGWVGRSNTSEVVDCFPECLQLKTGYISGGRTEAPAFGGRVSMQILVLWLTELTKLEQPASVFDTVVQSGEAKNPKNCPKPTKKTKRGLKSTSLILWLKLLEGRESSSINRSDFSISRTDTQAKRVKKHFCSS